MPSLISPRLKRRLCDIVGRASLLDDPAGRAAYAYDSSLHPGRPDLVLFPKSTEQVAGIVKLLASAKIPYVPRGAGTNLSGGSIASRGGAVIALSAMRDIIEINRASLFARVQPGVTNLRLQEELKEYGCFFAPDPASQRVSTIGGNLAENSGGPHCLKYGVTSNHILGATIVAPEGEILELGGERLYSPGLDVLGLFVGSEGTLGIATEIVCRILPLPQAVRTMLAIFDSTEDAGQTVSDVIAAGIIPATLEMMDNIVIRAVEQALHAGYPTDAASVLIIEVDGMEEALAELIGRIEHICRRNNVRDVRIARDERERDILWTGRRGAFGAVARMFPNYSVSDGTVPRTELPSVLRQVTNIAKKYELTIGNVFHAGDGNLHPLIFFDARDSEQLDRVHRAGKEILAACVTAGGTISGEHGVGDEKIDSMSLVFRPVEMELMRQLKHALDPDDLCNPNKILPEETETLKNDSPKHTATPLAAGKVAGIPCYAFSNINELADFASESLLKKLTLAAVGSDTLFSRLPHRLMPDALVSTRKLNSIIEHDVENLTVTAQAGVTLQEVQKELKQNNQFLPLDAPPQATLGGIVSAGLPGLRRHLYGAPRDLILGLKYIDCFGRKLGAGGKTVKNVAGYDYGKLLIGSWGTLGIITEITFRLLPLPNYLEAFYAEFDGIGHACEASVRIMKAGLNPSFLVFSDQKKKPYLLLCGAEGAEAAVKKQIAEMKQIAAAHSGQISTTVVGESYQNILSAYTESCYSFAHPGSILSVCISFSLEGARKAVDAVTDIEKEYAVSAAITVGLTGGFLYAHFDGKGDSKPGNVVPLFEGIKKMLPNAAIVVLAYKKNAAEDLSDSEALPFVIGGGPAEWTKKVSHCFDMANRLNPGLKLW